MSKISRGTSRGARDRHDGIPGTLVLVILAGIILICFIWGN